LNIGDGIPKSKIHRQMKKQIFCSILFLLTSYCRNLCQKGSITGYVTDISTEEKIPFVTVGAFPETAILLKR